MAARSTPADAVPRQLPHQVLRAAHAELGWDGFSASCALPPLAPPPVEPARPGAAAAASSSSRAGLPWLCRLVGRGSYSGLVSDVSANELYELPVVPVDLVDAAARLRLFSASAGLCHSSEDCPGA